MLPAVVPAYNEGPRIRAVVSKLISTGLFSRVIVVDDGSQDDTAAQARAAGAEVFQQPKNLGKAQAMKRGWYEAGQGDVAFFDADLVGLERWHCEALLAGYQAGYDQTCGLRDYTYLGRPLHVFGPIITGERVVRRRVLEAVPWDCWHGFDIETAINATCDRLGGKTALFFMRGANHTQKGAKRGLFSGLFQDASMFRRIRKVRRTLASNGGVSCTARRLS